MFALKDQQKKNSGTLLLSRFQLKAKINWAFFRIAICVTQSSYCRPYPVSILQLWSSSHSNGIMELKPNKYWKEVFVWWNCELTRPGEVCAAAQRVSGGFSIKLKDFSQQLSVELWEIHRTWAPLCRIETWFWSYGEQRGFSAPSERLSPHRSLVQQDPYLLLPATLEDDIWDNFNLNSYWNPW